MVRLSLAVDLRKSQWKEDLRRTAKFRCIPGGTTCEGVRAERLAVWQQRGSSVRAHLARLTPDDVDTKSQLKQGPWAGGLSSLIEKIAASCESFSYGTCSCSVCTVVFFSVSELCV